jgi:hypothetical protein
MLFAAGGGLFDFIGGIFKKAGDIITKPIKAVAGLAGTVIKATGISGISTPFGGATFSGDTGISGGGVGATMPVNVSVAAEKGSLFAGLNLGTLLPIVLIGGLALVAVFMMTKKH